VLCSAWKGDISLSSSVLYLEVLIRLKTKEKETTNVPETLCSADNSYYLQVIHVQNFTTTLLQTDLIVFLQAVLQKPNRRNVWRCWFRSIRSIQIAWKPLWCACVWQGDVMEEHFWNVSCGTNPTRESIQTSQCFNTAVEFTVSLQTSSQGLQPFFLLNAAPLILLRGLTCGALPLIAAWIMVQKAEPNFYPFRFFSSFCVCQRWCTQTALAFESPSFSTIAITLPWSRDRVQHNPSAMRW